MCLKKIHRSINKSTKEAFFFLSTWTFSLFLSNYSIDITLCNLIGGAFIISDIRYSTFADILAHTRLNNLIVSSCYEHMPDSVTDDTFNTSLATTIWIGFGLRITLIW